MDNKIPQIIILAGIIAIVSSSTCPSGRFGPPSCVGRCHCDSGEEVCDPGDGKCSVGFCERGWMSPPNCQTVCPPGTFGLNCDWKCHCPEGDICSIVSGVCSGGNCEYGWAGPSCQTRLPVFTCAINTTNISPTSITVTWRRWSPKQDIGNGPVVYYLLEYQEMHASKWTEASSRVESPNADFFVHIITSLKPNTAYRFRIILGYSVGRKWLKSIPSLSSDWKWTLPVSSEQIITTSKPTTSAETLSPEPTSPFPSTPIEAQTQEPILEKIREPGTDGEEQIISVSLEMKSRSEDTLHLVWSSEQSSPLPWSAYEVFIQKVTSLSSAASPPKTTIQTHSNSLEVRNLPPATLFAISVQPMEILPSVCFNGTNASGKFWTEPKPPPKPTAPEFIRSTDTTIEIKLFGLPPQNLSMTVQILVEDISHANGSALELSEELDLEELMEYLQQDEKEKPQHRRHKELKWIYITAEFGIEILSLHGSNFVIGDNTTERKYQNRPLSPDTEYIIWILYKVMLDGVTKSSISRTSFTVIPASGVASYAVKDNIAGYVNVTMIVCLSVFIPIIIACIAVGAYYL